MAATVCTTPVVEMVLHYVYVPNDIFVRMSTPFFTRSSAACLARRYPYILHWTDKLIILSATFKTAIELCSCGRVQGRMSENCELWQCKCSEKPFSALVDSRCSGFTCVHRAAALLLEHLDR